jgi:hypothetical protein
MTAGVIAAAGGPGILDAVAGGPGKFYAATVPASSIVTPGILGFLVFAALAVALVFLLRSMNKQFRKITPDPGPAPGPAAPDAAATTADGPVRQETPK